MSHPSIGFIGGGRVARILLGSWRRPGVEVSQVPAPEEVVDLIPVKPLADFEAELRNAYRSRLTALYDKIHP